MKRRYLIMVLMLISLLMKAADGYHVCTFNIRTSKMNDGRNGWADRRDSVVRFIMSEHLDVIGMQEVTDKQMKNLRKLLGGYACVGVARDDGMRKGEYNPVFYNTKRLEALDDGTFWLSETPEELGSKGWDGACCRIATWVRLRDKSSGEQFVMVNTHLDHVGREARVKGARLIAERMSELADGLPVVMTMDMNDVARSAAWRVLAGSQLGLMDSYDAARQVTGENYTWHDFGRLPEYRRRKIDFVFVSQGIDVVNCHIPGQAMDVKGKTFYLSDHNPVIVEINVGN